MVLLGGGWFFSGFMALLTKEKRFRSEKLISGLVFAAFTIVNLGIYGPDVLHSIQISNPWRVFEHTFHEKAPSKTVMWHGRDSDGEDPTVELSFQADRAMFDRIRPKALQRVSPNEVSINPGEWWRAPTATTEVWKQDTRSDGSASSGPDGSPITVVIWMTWDEDGRVQYVRTGLD